MMELGSPSSAVPGNGTPPDSNAAHLSYVLAERNKRVRMLWGQSAEAHAARTYLMESCGFTEETIRRFHLGLIVSRAKGAESLGRTIICIPVPDSRGPEFAPCLAADRPGAKRRGQYVAVDTAGTTIKADEVESKRGAVLTMYISPAKGSDLIVCARVTEAILLSQFVELACPGRFSIIVSTHYTQFPAEWRISDFWARWHRVYLAHCPEAEVTMESSAGSLEGRCSQLASWAKRPLLRVEPASRLDENVKVDWVAVFRGQGSAKAVVEIFDNAVLFKQAGNIAQNPMGIEPPRLDQFAEGEYGDITHDVAYNYICGYYYYPFSVLRFSLGANQQKQITRQIKLLRNDGQILGWSRVPSTSGGSDVLAAEDRTLLSRPPEVSESATWALDHILSFARAAKNGSHRCRRLGEILRDMQQLFHQCVWLPRQEQLYLLLFTVPVTYVQELFAAVPYILITGPKGSGKSELALLLSRFSSNSTVIGCGSHAFTAAEIDRARGLIVLDDRETLAASELDPDFLELLKIGYKRATGVRGLVGQNRKLIRQHVYGVKAITCVSGVEEIVGTRMIRIQTAPFSKALAGTSIRRFLAADLEVADNLRQEMHSWAFKNVDLIQTTYAELTQTSSRWDEITAPLHVFSVLSEDAELQNKLKYALETQPVQEAIDVPLEEALSKLMEDLVRRGLMREVSVTHIKNEMELRLRDSSGQNREASHSGRVPESWITRTLKAQNWIKLESTVKRTRARKKVLQRVWPLNEDRVSSILQTLTPQPQEQNATSFCQHCDACEYVTICEIKRYFRQK